MIIKTKDIVCRGETLSLCNQRVIYWSKRGVLILSDLHIGKTAHFRKHGIPVSSSVMDKDLKRLNAVISFFNPKSIIIVGDLFHAEYNPDVITFQNWIQNHNKDMAWILVKGNHDKRHFKMFENTGITLIEESLYISPFTFQHDFRKHIEGEFYITGHTHPGVSINGKGKQRIKLPCFQVSENQIVLPAFSLFTGLNTNNPPLDSKIYAFSEDTILEVN